MSNLTAPTKAKPTEIRALAGARAIPPLLLVLYHYHEAHGYQHARWFDVFVAKGYLWVEFFFALSGFILVHVYGARAHDNKSPAVRGRGAERNGAGAGPPLQMSALSGAARAASTSPQGGGNLDRRRIQYFDFLKTRLARLYPLHLFTLLLMLVMVVFFRWLAARGGYVSIYDLPAYHPYSSFWSFIGNLFLVQAWDLFPRTSWNGVAWFVSVEWFLCLIFPGYLWIARGRIWNALACMALGFALLFVLANVSGHGLDITYDFGVIRGMGDFAVGVAMAMLYRELKPRADVLSVHWHSAAQVLVFGTFLYAIYNTGWSHTPRDYWVVPPLMALILVLAFDRGILARVFQSKPLRLLGEWSFAIYMGQTTFLQLLRYFEQRVYPDPSSTWVHTIHILEPTVLVILCTAWGAMLYHMIERPANDWLRRNWLRKSRSSPAAA